MRRGTVAAAVLLLTVTPLRAVILYGTGDPAINTSPPTTGALAGSGWQYEGQFGGFLGTVIASTFFITAKHIGGNVGQTFTFDGTNYTTIAVFPDPESDLQIWRVAGSFPIHAPLFNDAAGPELNLPLVVFGRGTQRGDPLFVGDNFHLGGWLWGAGDAVQRWGTNVISSIVTDSNYGKLLRAEFNSNAGPNEAHLSAGDSGGGVFVFNGESNQWELAGINLAVDGPFSTSSNGTNPFDAALFDTSGLFVQGDVGPWILAPNPSAFYATQIVAHRGFIESTVMGLTRVVSRRMQGNLGPYNVDLPVTGSPGIECRSGGATNDYQVVFTFARNVSVGGADVSGPGNVQEVTGSGNVVSVLLTGIPNAQTTVVILRDVNDGINTSDVEAKLSVLIADTNADGSVDSADITSTKSQSGSALTESNFREDINADGFIDSADISLVKSKSGTGLPSNSATLAAPVRSTSLRQLPLPQTHPRPSAILSRKKSREKQH